MVPAHFALAYTSRICVPRGLAVIPKRYTYAPAHLVFPGSWTGIPRTLDFASIGFPYAPAQGHAAPAGLSFTPRGLTGVFSRLDFAPVGFAYAPALLAWAYRSWTGFPRNLVYYPHEF